MKHLKGFIMVILIIAALGTMFVLTAGKDKEDAIEESMEITEPTSQVSGLGRRSGLDE